MCKDHGLCVCSYYCRERTGSDAKDASRRDNGRAAEGRDRKQDDASRAPHGDAAASKNVRGEMLSCAS